MKKLCTILLIAVILTACGGGEAVHQPPELIGDYIFGEGGVFTYDHVIPNSFSMNRRVSFTDLNSLVTVPICPRPNCNHIDESCSAVITENYNVLFYYNGSFYYDAWDVIIRGDEYIPTTKIIKMDIDGTNRREVAVLEKRMFMRSHSLLIMDGVLYALMEEWTYDYSGAAPVQRHHNEHYLYTFDLASHDFTQILHLGGGVGFTDDPTIKGVFDGNIYIATQYTDMGYSIALIHDSDAWYEYNQEREKSKDFKTYRLDIESGALIETDIAYLSIHSEDFIVYWEDSALYSLDKNGTHTKLENMTQNMRPGETKEYNETPPLRMYFYQFAGDKIIRIDWGEGFGWDLRENKPFDITDEAASMRFIGMFEGDFIFENVIFGANYAKTYEYHRLTEAELIKE